MESVDKLARYVRRRGSISVGALMAEGQYSSLRQYMSSTKAQVAKSLTEATFSEWTSQHSDFWNFFVDGLRDAVAVAEGVNKSDIRIFFDEFNIEDRGVEDYVLEFLFAQRIVITGNFVLDVEGVTPWPFPDPDLEFTWRVEGSLVGSVLEMACTIDFVDVQGPGWGWLLAIVGFFTVSWGGIFAAAGGLAVGEIIDRQYENPESEADVIDKFKKIYDGSDEVVWENITFSISRPNDRRFRFAIRIDLTSLTHEGLSGL